MNTAIRQASLRRSKRLIIDRRSKKIAPWLGITPCLGAEERMCVSDKLLTANKAEQHRRMVHPRRSRRTHCAVPKEGGVSQDTLPL